MENAGFAPGMTLIVISGVCAIVGTLIVRWKKGKTAQDVLMLMSVWGMCIFGVILGLSFISSPV